MGNTNTKKQKMEQQKIVTGDNTRPTSPLLPAEKTPGGLIHDLQCEITCSICLEILEDPVSIECGHNFCRDCISKQWKAFSPHGYCCPECRLPCSRERMKVDTRLRNLVDKIKEILRQEMERETAVAPAAAMPSGWQALQLLGLDEEGDLCLDEGALSSCLEQGEVKDAPVCLVTIFGEQRCGKSFLQNFLLRRLQNLGVEDASWMGQGDEPLTGFESCPGSDGITKGVWLWSQPFWITSEQGKVAVFLIDTEGSLDLGRSKEVSTKLSAFSMLLSSYQILNISKTMSSTDMEYLEMFVYAAEMVGKACGLKPFQQLDLLVRDSLVLDAYGLQAGQRYLQKVIQKMESNSEGHPRALETLKSRNTRCYLMPHPGKKLERQTEGTLEDMDDDFRECLKDYVSGLASSAGTYLKRDLEGKVLTGGQLAAKIKCLACYMKKQELDFPSAVQLTINLKNLEIKDTLKGEFAEFVGEQDQLSRPVFAGLKILPSTMAQRLKEKQDELLKKFEATALGDEPEWAESKLSLESHLQREAEAFLNRYGRRYKSHALAAGVAVGVGAVGLAGGVVGAGVAGAILAAEALVLGTEAAATVAIGALAGTGAFALVGGGVGAGIGSRIGKRRAQEMRRLSVSDVQVEEGDEEVSEQMCLIDE